MIFIKLSLLFSFLFLLATPRGGRIRRPHAINVVILTNESIGEVCHYAANPPRCESTLSPFKGKPLFPKPLGNVTEIARDNAKRTVKKIYSLYDSISDKRSALKLRYNRCLKRYGDAMTQISKADKHLRRGEVNGVLLYTGQAMNNVLGCDKELRKRPREPSNLSKDIQELREIVNVIHIICKLVFISGRD